MPKWGLSFVALLFASARVSPVAAQGLRVTYSDVIAAARTAAPDLRVARSRELVAQSEIRIAGAFLNPVLSLGTSTQAAQASATGSLPLLVFGQRGASEEASKAELSTVKVDSETTWAEVKLRAEVAFIALWRSEEIANERERAAALSKRLEDLVRARVDIGAAPSLELLRVRAERLRADADAAEAHQAVLAAGSGLGRWIGRQDDVAIRTYGGLVVPAQAPALASLKARAATHPLVRREEADARAAEARVRREKALVRPALTLDVGFDALDPSLSSTNFRGQLGFDVPLLNQRGGQIERERASAGLAHSRRDVAAAQLSAELSVAYRLFEAMSARCRGLAEGVIPAAEAVANATEESYVLGRAQLLAVLDAARLKIEANVSLREAEASRATAWAEIERITGVR